MGTQGKISLDSLMSIMGTLILLVVAACIAAIVVLLIPYLKVARDKRKIIFYEELIQILDEEICKRKIKI